MYQPLQSVASIRVAGAERRAFLQGQLTQDLQLVTPANPLLAGWLNPKGRLLTLAWVIDWQEALHLLMPAELVPGLARRLQMFVLRARVEISTPATPVWFSSDKTVVNTSTNQEDNEYFYSFVTPAGTVLLGHPEAAEAGSAAADSSWRAAAIRAGLPVITAATREQFVPQMINLDLLGGISFTKGCYVGQEIVARTQNLGRIKRRMFRFASTAAGLMPGDPVMAGDAVAGAVVDACRQESATELLAVIKLDYAGRPLTAGGAALEQLTLPYTVPEAAA